MKFVCIGGPNAEKEVLTSEYKTAKRLGEVRIGEHHFFYRYFIKIRYASIDEIERAYLREESGESGEFLLLESYLMLRMRDKSLHKLRMERELYARAVLLYFEENYPHIAIGFDE
ncbi:MAG: hypothetical protein J1F18_09840 [Lachnospiraceae bacterium]|nr:hypothetical protein [Lachnospiraceae bacterium]